MDEPPQEPTNEPTNEQSKAQVVFQNKLLSANMVAGSSYVVAIVAALHTNHDESNFGAYDFSASNFSDYNFRNQSSVNAIDEAYKSFISFEAVANADFSITELGDDDEIKIVDFNSVESLSQPVKHEAIRLAHDILNKLKIRFGNESLDGVMKNGDINAIKILLNGVDKVAITFKNHLDMAEKIAPELLEDDDVISANNSIGAFKHQGKKQLIKDLETELAAAKASGNSALIYELTQAINKLKVEVATAPEEHKSGSNKPIKDLIEAIEIGMDKLAQKMQEMTQAGLSSAPSARDLGGESQAQQSGKTSTMDLGKPQNDAAKQNEIASQQNNNMQKASELMQTERATNKANAAQSQQADAQKTKENQEARQTRQEARQQRSERQMRQEARQQTQTQQTQEQQARQQRQEARQQQQSRQQRQESRQQVTTSNEGSIADNLRQMRKEQQQKAQPQPATPEKAPTLNQPTSKAQPVTQTSNMQSMLAVSGIEGLQNMNMLQSMAAMQNMEVPDALKPNSPARMIKAITQQKEAEQVRSQTIASSDVSSAPSVSTSDLPILIKQNNQIIR